MHRFTRPSTVTSGRKLYPGNAWWFVIVPAAVSLWVGFYYGGRAILGLF
jgi:hypothetical protein